jgi:hypothetical protein
VGSRTHICENTSNIDVTTVFLQSHFFLRQKQRSDISDFIIDNIYIKKKNTILIGQLKMKFQNRKTSLSKFN